MSFSTFRCMVTDNFGLYRKSDALYKIIARTQVYVFYTGTLQTDLTRGQYLFINMASNLKARWISVCLLGFIAIGLLGTFLGGQGSLVDVYNPVKNAKSILFEVGICQVLYTVLISCIGPK